MSDNILPNPGRAGYDPPCGWYIFIVEKVHEGWYMAMQAQRVVPVTDEPVVEEPPATEEPATPAAAEIAALIEEAQQHYARAQELLMAGDWAGYGQELEALGEVLVHLEELISGE